MTGGKGVTIERGGLLVPSAFFDGLKSLLLPIAGGGGGRVTPLMGTGIPDEGSDAVVVLLAAAASGGTCSCCCESTFDDGGGGLCGDTAPSSATRPSAPNGGASWTASGAIRGLTLGLTLGLIVRSEDDFSSTIGFIRIDLDLDIISDTLFSFSNFFAFGLALDEGSKIKLAVCNTRDAIDRYSRSSLFTSSWVFTSWRKIFLTKFRPTCTSTTE